MNLIKITNDLFDIASRLKSVKETYVLYFNTYKNRYEVHDTAQRCSTFAFAVPYAELDARTIEYARKTSVQNAEALFAEIDRNNAFLQKRAISGQVDKSMENYCKRRFYERC